MIEGKQIFIRQLEPGDEAALHRWWNDGTLMSHATHSFGILQSKEAIRLQILKELECYTMFPENKRFLICTKADGKSIGEINYSDWDGRNQSCELGIKICEVAEQRKGYGKDALYHFIDFLFRFLNLNRIELTTTTDNQRAHNLYRKLGFKEIGIIRQGYFDSRTGSFIDVLYLDLLKNEWQDIKGNIDF